MISTKKGRTNSLCKSNRFCENCVSNSVLHLPIAMGPEHAHKLKLDTHIKQSYREKQNAFKRRRFKLPIKLLTWRFYFFNEFVENVKNWV